MYKYMINDNDEQTHKACPVWWAVETSRSRWPSTWLHCKVFQLLDRQTWPSYQDRRLNAPWSCSNRRLFENDKDRISTRVSELAYNEVSVNPEDHDRWRPPLPIVSGALDSSWFFFFLNENSFYTIPILQKPFENLN